MNCERFEELVLDYINGNLSDQEKAEFLTHMDDCAKCSEVYDHYNSIRSMLESEEEILPSERVLKDIGEYAKNSLKNENPSFF